MKALAMTNDLLLRRVDLSVQLGNWINPEVNKLDLRVKDNRTQICGGLFYVTLNHHQSIVLLIANALPTSAASLIRPLIETYVRAIWLHRCATDNQFDGFRRGDRIERFGQLVAAIENLEEFKGGALRKIKGAFGTAMNDYVHSGIQLVMRHLTKNRIETNYSDDELFELLYLADSFALMAVIEMARMADNTDLMYSALNQMTVLRLRPDA
jgi:hypothetical protein